MKGLKKFLTGILAGAMALTMTLSTGTAMTAKADDAGATITVNNAIAGQVYSAYKVFDYIPAGEDSTQGGVYKLNSDFAELANYKYGEGENDVMSKFFTIGDGDILNTEGLGTADNSDTVKTFGKAVIDFAKANNITPYTAKATGETGTETTVTINVGGYGYYVVDTTLGTAVSVDTNTPNAQIAEKNDVPSLDKKITGATNADTIATDMTGNDAQIGDVVEFTITADLKKGGKNYVVTDKLDDGLTLDASSIVVSFSAAEMQYTTNASYTAADGKKGFQITFTGEPSEDTTAKITYNATVNTNAKINPEVNVNEAYLTYGHNAETTHITTETKTYPMILRKVIKDTDTLLADAHFSIYRKSDASLIKFSKVSDTEYVVDPDGEVTDIVTVDTDQIMLKGFNLETYVFVETAAPDGYNLIEADGTFTPAGGEATTHFQEATVVVNTAEAGIYTAKIENGTGLLLPSTGGIGTTIFYIIGGLLIVAAVVFFVVRRKADAE